jgi:type VI secretion system protein ImpB
MSDSTQHKLDRIRPPRVQITYDVEVGGAIQTKELPLVVGILADLAGQPEEPLPRLKERKFIQIDRDNFDEVLASYQPRLKLTVANRLQQEGQPLSVQLRFERLEDFEPLQLVQRIEPLKKLLEVRQRLVDLIAKLDGNDALNALLQGLLTDANGLQQLKAELEKPAS